MSKTWRRSHGGHGPTVSNGLLRLLIGIGLAGALLPCIAATKDRVVWLSLETGEPRLPASASSPMAPRGPGEQARLWLIERLPGFTHVHDTASIARIERLIEVGGATYCYANALRTPKREAYGMFSDAVMHRLPNRVIARADRLDSMTMHLNGRAQVQLTSLFNDQKLLGAVTSQRSYGSLVDPVLAAASAPHRVAQFNVPGRMLMTGRVDWVIAEPAEIGRLVRNEPGLASTPMRSFEIAGESAPVLSYVMCSRTPTARTLLEALNHLMNAHPDRPWERPYLELLNAAEREDLLRMTRTPLR